MALVTIVLERAALKCDQLPVVQEKKLFKGFSIFSCGGHLVQLSGMI